MRANEIHSRSVSLPLSVRKNASCNLSYRRHQTRMCVFACVSGSCGGYVLRILCACIYVTMDVCECSHTVTYINMQNFNKHTTCKHI